MLRNLQRSSKLPFSAEPTRTSVELERQALLLGTLAISKELINGEFQQPQSGFWKIHHHVGANSDFGRCGGDEAIYVLGRNIGWCSCIRCILTVVGDLPILKFLAA